MSFNTITIASQAQKIEGEAGGTFLPGSIIEMQADGKYVAHPTADGAASFLVAVENPILTNDIDDAYESGDNVKMVAANRGDVFYCLLGSGTCTKGDYLASNGDGALKAAPAPASGGAVLGIALDDADASSGAVRIRVRVA